MARTSQPHEMNSFPCPHCEGRLDVKDSRPTTYRSMRSIRRRRRCNKCGFRVTTFEVVGTDRDIVEARLPRVVSAARTAKNAIDALIAQYDGTDQHLDEAAE